MVRFRLLGAALVLSCAHLPAQQYTPAARQQDLNWISTQLPILHVNFFSQLDRTDFQRALDALATRTTAATDAEFYIGLAQLVAMAGDPHTNLYLSGNTFQHFPITFRWLDDGLFAVAAPSPYIRALRARLIAVGGMPIDQVTERLGTVIPHANQQWLHSQVQDAITNQQALEGLHIVPAGGPYTFQFQTLAGEVFSLDLLPGSGALVSAPDPASGPIPSWLRNAGANYWYSYSAPNRLLYFKYNMCGPDRANPFPAFAADILNVLDHQPVDTFVFDFRGNPGGSDSLWGPLVEGLQLRLPAMLANPRFRIYDVIDKGTFSSGLGDAMALKQPLPAEFAALAPGFDLKNLIQIVGEPTGGRPSGYGEVLPFTLPASQLMGQYSTKYFSNPDYIPDLPSFYPDISIPLRSTDYFARNDLVMAAILARTPGFPQPPQGDVIVANGASFRGDQGIAPGSIAAAFGTFPIPPDQLLIAGEPVSTIFSSGPNQVNFLVPAATSPGRATISVRAGARELATGETTITAAAPGIFLADPSDPAQPGALANPAARGGVLEIFATGAAAPVQVYFADTPASVQYSGLMPQFPGLWQINAQIPTGITGQVPLFIVSGNLASNAVTVNVR